MAELRITTDSQYDEATAEVQLVYEALVESAALRNPQDQVMLKYRDSASGQLFMETVTFDKLLAADYKELLSVVLNQHYEVVAINYSQQKLKRKEIAGIEAPVHRSQLGKEFVLTYQPAKKAGEQQQEETFFTKYVRRGLSVALVHPRWIGPTVRVEQAGPGGHAAADAATAATQLIIDVVIMGVCTSKNMLSYESNPRLMERPEPPGRNYTNKIARIVEAISRLEKQQELTELEAYIIERVDEWFEEEEEEKEPKRPALNLAKIDFLIAARKPKPKPL